MKQIFILVIFASISTALFAKTENLTKSEIQISFLKPKKSMFGTIQIMDIISTLLVH
jgi:Na+-translocating ferredoxin:NAD+ oxidoreductase RnfG subunit